MSSQPDPSLWHTFTSSVAQIPLPEQFTFPFYYEPHLLSKMAANDLQSQLQINQSTTSGKMFGVLVVQDRAGNVGYLKAFSGKLGLQNSAPGFVPPLFDLLDPNTHFARCEKEVNAINAQLLELENNPQLQQRNDVLQQAQRQFELDALEHKARLKTLKAARKTARSNFDPLTANVTAEFFADDLIKQSLRDKHEWNVFTATARQKLDELQSACLELEQPIALLKEARKTKSNALQQWLFDQYHFLNIRGEKQSLIEIFAQTTQQVPPAAAGDCAAPKLLQAAFVNGWKPIALAEFWWGAAPKSEIRKHGYFYPACRGKCEPILLHMLRGLAVADNPLLINPAVSLELEILFEDHSIWVVNKPAEMLSVPGIYIQDSAWSRLKSRSNKTADPLVVHRLDMATSGLLVFAKDKASHQVLQDQFIKKTIKKRYTALLDGDLKADQGQIELPLRVDLDDRPRQLVCYTHGKPALTKYKTIEVKDGKTRIHFWPISGRTHQLRVHAAHSLGLHTPIVGDDLYGTKSDRLYLHAEYLEFTHPKTGELMHFYLPAPF